MFGNNQFYPTPDNVISMMLGTMDVNRKNVLDPEAGKGDILEFCSELGANVYSCEINEDLAKIVQSKSTFIKHDFLKVIPSEITHIDVILMNPPFNSADTHILHAWHNAPDGCEIVALCNYETLKNAYTRGRSELKRLINDYGFSENIGDVFTIAERKTGIDIGLIRLYKPLSTDSFEGFFSEDEDEEEKHTNGIMEYNLVREGVQRYVSACRLFESVAENAVQMNNLVSVFGVPKIALSIKEDEKITTIQSFKKELQKKAWDWIFRKMKMDKYITSKLKEEINKFVEKQQNIPFTMKNVYKMFEVVAGTNGSRMERVIIEVFDKITLHYDENRYFVEGWKTNSHYMVNQKFIVDHVAENNNWNGTPSIRYSGNAEKLDDLTKALCYLTGTDYNQIPTLYSFFQSKERTIINEKGESVKYRDEKGDVERIYKEWGTWYDWGFFEVKVFKKSTLHAKFKDKAVWELFNRAVAKAKGYPLPENVKL